MHRHGLPLTRRGRITVACSAAAVALVMGAAGALAYFHAIGTGSAAATSGTAQAVTVQAVASGTPSSLLMPGGSADLLVQVSNPNSLPVRITGITQNGTTVTVVGGSGCTSANSGVSVPTQAGLVVTVAPGTQVVHIANGAAMGTGSANGCQGASFDIPVLLTVVMP